MHCSYSRLRDNIRAISSNLSKEKSTIKALKRDIRLSAEEKPFDWYENPLLKGAALMCINI
jgi:hypothetical protein